MSNIKFRNHQLLHGKAGIDQPLEGYEDGTVLQLGFCMSVGGSGRGTDEWVNGVFACV